MVDLGRYAAAISDYDIAIRLQPDDASTYYNRGNVKIELEQYAAAISDYDIAIRLKPDYAAAYNNRGVVKDALGRTPEARRDLRIALRLATETGDTTLKAEAEKTLRIFNE